MLLRLFVILSCCCCCCLGQCAVADEISTSSLLSLGYTSIEGSLLNGSPLSTSMSCSGIDIKGKVLLFYINPENLDSLFLSTCDFNTDFNTVLAVWSECDGGTCEAYNDDADCGENSIMDVRPSVPFYVSVSSFSGDDTGLFVLHIYTQDYYSEYGHYQWWSGSSFSIGSLIFLIIFGIVFSISFCTGGAKLFVSGASKILDKCENCFDSIKSRRSSIDWNSELHNISVTPDYPKGQSISEHDELKEKSSPITVSSAKLDKISTEDSSISGSGSLSDPSSSGGSISDSSSTSGDSPPDYSSICKDPPPKPALPQEQQETVLWSSNSKPSVPPSFVDTSQTHNQPTSNVLWSSEPSVPSSEQEKPETKTISIQQPKKGQTLLGALFANPFKGKTQG